MTDTPPLALRSGQADWETEMWVRAAVALIADDVPPEVPLLITDRDLQAMRQAVAELIAERRGAAP